MVCPYVLVCVYVCEWLIQILIYEVNLRAVRYVEHVFTVFCNEIDMFEVLFCIFVFDLSFVLLAYQN